MAAPPLTAEVPSWMTKEYFVEVVAKKYGLDEGDFTIDDLHVKPATEAGDNYASKLYRASVGVSCKDGSTKKTSLIVKALVNMGLAEEVIQMLNVFPKEKEMYADIIPALEQLYREKGISVEFGPKCYKNATQPTDSLVLEDLSDRQFRMANRREGLDLEHTRVFLKKLAQFHAASAVLYQRKGPYSSVFDEGMYAERSKVMFEAHMKPHMESMTKMVRLWPNGEYYAEILQDFGLSMLDELIKTTRAKCDRFNVLNHGDAWCNNLLFKYNADNTIAELVPIDYQMCVWSSPTLDLLYFIFTSVRGDIRLPELDNMINFYHRNLTENLNLLEYSKPIPSLKELHLDFIDHSTYGFAACFGVLPICLMEKTENASMDTMMSADDAGRLFREKLFSTPEYVRQMTELLPFFCEYGAFDIQQSGFQTPSGVRSDYLNLPGWFRREFFNDVVEKKLHLRNGNYYIRQLDVSIATNKGDNYGSVMYRCKINVENQANNSEESFSVIVKTRPTGMAADFSDALNPFTKEIEMYEKLLPAFEALYVDRDLGVEIGPRCLKTCEKIPSDVIVMEDLRSVRYKPVKRQDGLDQEHTERILEKLAQFHAASAVYSVRNDGFSKVFAQGLYSDKNLPMMEHMFMPAYKACIEELKQNVSTQEFIEELEKLLPVAFSRTMDCLVVDPDGFNVLNHGDFWINNVMFKYGTDGRLEDASLVDFQMCFYGSPVLDLNYFLFTSVKEDIRLVKLNHFIRHYHEHLVSNLAILGYGRPLPTLKKLQMDFYDRIVYGAATMFGLNALCHVEPTGDLNMEAMFMDNETGRRCRKDMYGNERYLRSMEQLLPFFRKKGALSEDAGICKIAKKKV